MNLVLSLLSALQLQVCVDEAFGGFVRDFLVVVVSPY